MPLCRLVITRRSVDSTWTECELLSTTILHLIRSPEEVQPIPTICESFMLSVSVLISVFIVFSAVGLWSQ
jgi:hypothetical protein